jgi:FAD/FMN-containing dehydrogenase/Fe-S oxidoreductase
VAGPHDRTSGAPRRLETDLRAALRGEVLFSPGDRALYSTDASNYRHVPIGVVVPRDIEDLVAAVQVCRAHDAPILPRGGGTSLAGQCCNVAVVLDCSKYLRRIVAVDPAARTARVQPGVVLDALRAAAEVHGLTFGPDPASHGWCTLGGMIGNNSCGVHSIMAGKTDANVVSLDVLTYDGVRMQVGATTDAALDRIVAGGDRRGDVHARLRALRDRYADRIRTRYPDVPRRVSGYNLDALLPENGFDVARALVGTEGTCVTVLEATVRLIESPPGRTLLVLGYPDVFAAADAVPAVLAAGCIGLEGFDQVMVDGMRATGLHASNLSLLPDGGGWLLAEFGGEDADEAAGRARALMTSIGRGAGAPSTRLFEDTQDQRRVWEIRESGLAATVSVPGQPNTWEGWEDAGVPVERLGGYLRELRALADRYGYRCPLYGHFGDGCVHNRMTYDLRTPGGVAAYRAFVEEAADLVVSYGGSLSGEHGDGQSRAELLPKMFGPELVVAFREFKSIWDPNGQMNPGRVVDPLPLDGDLRLGPDYRPARPTTVFAFPADGGSLAAAAERCVGVGKCRRTEGGVMCPSYMATRDERHSTRGRARLLVEVMRGDPLTQGWRDANVRDALDLCLSCKGCKSDCPVSVDVATYKAEYLHHHYRGRVRPRAAYATGMIHRWARAGSLAPGMANALTGAPGVSAVVKAAAGIAPGRRVPKLARQTFRRWFEARGPQGEVGKRSVVLWPDTFTDRFHPWVARAAVEVLEAAGHRVLLPTRGLCCGRPLYDHGMLTHARREGRRSVESLRPFADRGVPIVGLEPSCVAVFRDELPNLFPNDAATREVAAAMRTFAEFADDRPEVAPAGTLDRPALVQTHCHQHAVMGFDADLRVMARAGLEVERPNPGCCGMAGGFGFERGRKYEVSCAVAEQALLPALREAPADVLVLADGFSCREQIAQLGGRRALHLAEALRMAR